MAKSQPRYRYDKYWLLEMQESQYPVIIDFT